MAIAQPAGGNDALMQQIMKMFGIASGAGGVGSGVWGLTHPGKNPSTDTINTLNGIPGKVQPFYQPYQESGKTALNDLQTQNKGLLGGTTQNDLGAGYKESPGYKYALQQALQEGNNAQAAGGMLGTPQHQEQNMDVASGLASRDYNNYMDRQTNLYNTGYNGTSHLNDQGYDANKGMADTVGNVENLKGGYQYAGQAGKNKEHADLLNQIFSGLGMIGGSYLGGPAGGATGGTGASAIYEQLKKLFGGG